MDYIYAKYKYSGRIKLIRMLALLAVVVGLFCVGIHKIFGDAVSLGFNVFAWLVLIIGALLVLVIGYLEIYKQSDIGKLYPVIALTIGIIFILIVPAFETPDEQDHFGSAYDLSNTWLGYGDPVSDGVASSERIRYMRAEDAQVKGADLTTTIGDADYDKVFSHFGLVNADANTKVTATDYSANAGYAMYILPAVGITIARVCHLGFGWVYFLGAFLNLIFYVVLTTYAIRKIPVGKRILFVVSLLPVMLQQISSFSYDCALCACIMVVTAQAFFLKYGDPSTRRDIKWNIEIPIIRTTITELVIYIFCALLLSTVKSGVFLVVMLLPFILCINKRWFTGSAKKFTIAAIVLIVLAIAAYMIFLGGYAKVVTFLITPPGNVREIQGLTGIAPIDYIKSPSKFFGILFLTVKDNAGHYIAQIGGTALGYNRIFIFKFIYMFNLLMILASLIRYNKETDVYKAGNRIVTFIIGLIPIMITVLAMLLYWTLPTDTMITGFQGRYLLPTMAILMLAIGRWKKLRIPNVDNLFVIFMTISGYVSCISVLSFM